jgi:hypothetical protein
LFSQVGLQIRVTKFIWLPDEALLLDGEMKMKGIPKKFFRGSQLNQVLLQVSTDIKFRAGDKHPQVKGIVFVSYYQKSKKQTWTTFEKRKKQKKAFNEKQRKQRNSFGADYSKREGLTVDIAKKYVHQTGRDRGLLNQGLLQVKTEKVFRRGDNHPKAKNIVFDCVKKNVKNVQRWMSLKVYITSKKPPSKYDLLQVNTNKKFEKGDPHPREKNLFFSYYGPNGRQRWITSEQEKIVGEKSKKRQRVKSKTWGKVPPKLNQEKLQIKTVKRFKQGDPHPEEKDIVFHSYRPTGRQRWQTLEQHGGLKRYRGEYREENLEKVRKGRRESAKRTYQDDPAKIKARSRAWQKKNYDKVLAWKALNHKDRMKNDLQYAIEKRLRTSITNKMRTLKNGNANKAAPTMDLVGCSTNEFIKYMESKFKDGMTWGNYGLHGWHIDHIKPCAMFDLTDPRQQRECFHYTNLQPLWAEENLKKGKKLETVFF